MTVIADDTKRICDQYIKYNMQVTPIYRHRYFPKLYIEPNIAYSILHIDISQKVIKSFQDGLHHAIHIRRLSSIAELAKDSE